MPPRRSVPPTSLECAFAIAFLLLAGTAAASLALAELNLFSRTGLLAVLVPGLLVGGWFIVRDHRRLAVNLPGFGPTTVLLVCATAVAAVSARPAEYYISGGDASVYLNIAAAIERRGGLDVTDPLLTAIDDDAREVLFGRDPLAPHLLNFHPGGIQIAADGQRLQFGFFHLLPAVIAGFSTLAGSPTAGLLVVPLSAVLTVVGIWLLGVRITSPLAATIAAGLLTVNFAHLWFARYPSSEMLTAALLVAGLAFTVRAAHDGSRVAGALAGAAFGLAASARLDVFALVSPAVAAYLLLLATRRQWTDATTSLAVGFMLFTLQAALHAALVAAPYSARMLTQVFASDWWFSRTTLLLPAALVAAAVLALVVVNRRPAVMTRPATRVGLTLLLLFAIVRSWPQFWEGPAALLLTPVGLAAMVCGAVWLLTDEPEPEVLLLVGLFVASALAFVDAPRAGRWYPLMWRRFVPVVVPIGLLLSGHALAVLFQQRAWWRWSGPLVAAGLAMVFASKSWWLVAAEPLRGVRNQLTDVVAQLPAGSVLVTDASTPSHFGLSLHFGLDQPVLAMRSGAGAAAALERVGERLAASGRTLMLAVSPHPVEGGVRSSDVAGFDLLPSGQTTLRWDDVERSMTATPIRLQPIEAPVEFYDLRPARRRALPVPIEIGTMDFPARGVGFHGAEPLSDTAARWTAGVAGVLVPAMEPARQVRMVMRLAAPRPPGVPAPSVTVSLGDLLIGVTGPVPPSFSEFILDLPAEAVVRLSAAPSELRLRTPPFVPRDTGLGDDTRELGVVVDWFRFEAR